MTSNNSSIRLLMDIMKPTTTAAAVDGVCSLNCGAICNNGASPDQNSQASEVKREDTGNKERFPWDPSEECISRVEDRADTRCATPDYSEYARDCEESHQQGGCQQQQHLEHDLVEVNSEEAADAGCLFGEFGFRHFILDLFSSINPCRLRNLRDELRKAKESNDRIEWELKTQLLRIRQQREAMENKLRSEIDNEISQTEMLQGYLETEQSESDMRDDEQMIADAAQTISALATYKKEKLRSKPLVDTVSSTIGVSSSTVDCELESNNVISLDEILMAAE